MTEGTRTTVRGRSVDHPLETANPALLTVRSKPKMFPTPHRSLQSESPRFRSARPTAPPGWGMGGVAIMNAQAVTNHL